jgi:hypothetical protein
MRTKDITVAGTQHIDVARWKPLIYLFRHYLGVGEPSRATSVQTPDARSGVAGGSARGRGRVAELVAHRALTFAAGRSALLACVRHLVSAATRSALIDCCRLAICARMPESWVAPARLVPAAASCRFSSAICRPTCWLRDSNGP